jgi:hypothetical protein
MLAELHTREIGAGSLTQKESKSCQNLKSYRETAQRMAS